MLRVNKHFGGKICVSVLFNNCFQFSIKITVKYNSSAGCKQSGQNSLVLQSFILLRLIKWEPGISGNLEVKSKLSPRNGSSLDAVEPYP